MDQLNPRTSPHSVEAEQSVLGAILIDPKCVADVIDVLRPDDFFMRPNAEIFDAIVSMFTMSVPIDAVTVLDELRHRGVYELCGGREYFMALLEVTPTSTNVLRYANIVRDRSIMRKLAAASAEITEAVTEGSANSGELLDLAESKIYSIRSGQVAGLTHIGTAIGDVYRNLDTLVKNKGKLPGTTTGFADLDALLSGLGNSDLVLIAARPGMGKTSLGLAFAYNAARLEDKDVVFFSLEMSNIQLATRLISMVSLVDSNHLITGKLSDDEWDAVANAALVLSNTHFYMDDQPDITVAEMKARCRRHRDKIGLVVIDYLQLITSGRHTDNRVQEVSEITRSLKIMAKELNVPVVVLSQLNRGPEIRNDKRPHMSDLRESGSIEQDADAVMLIYRDDYYNKEASEEPGIAELLVEKNRHGETGTIKLSWDGAHTRFTGLERSEAPEY